MKINIDSNVLIQLAKKYDTPCYVYNKSTIVENYQLYQRGFDNHNYPYLICYAVKANSNLAILNLLHKLGSGFDIVSLGELNRVQKAGGDCTKVVFSGVGKQDFEIKAALEANILCFNIESEPELILINSIATQLNKRAPVSFRINPNIDAKSHPYISTGLAEHKFGIDIKNAETIYKMAQDFNNIKIIGLDCHIGSQLTDIKPLEQACSAINNLLIKLNNSGIHITHVNMGGGLGIDYEHNDNQPNLPSRQAWVDTIINNLKTDPKTTLIIEPGRSIVGNAGLLLSKVIYNKNDPANTHNFTIIDAGMNDLLRPALYGAKHKILNLSDNSTADNFNNLQSFVSIVGPVCESSDTFSKAVNFSSKPGDILAILDTGAYGFCMSSNYNSRPRAAEVLLDEYNTDNLIRQRETIEDLYQHETIIH